MRRPILGGYDPKRADPAPVESGAVLSRLTRARLIVASVRAAVPVLPIDPAFWAREVGLWPESHEIPWNSW